MTCNKRASGFGAVAELFRVFIYISGSQISSILSVMSSSMSTKDTIKTINHYKKSLETPNVEEKRVSVFRNRK